VLWRRSRQPAGERWLFIGLGNPGRDYQESRHNLGFMVVDEVARRNGVRVDSRSARSLLGELRTKDKLVILAKPQTMMNLSGEAAAALRKKYSISLDRIVAIHDELDLPFGRLQIRKSGGPAGHHGVESLILRLGSKDFARFRMGIGEDGIDYVLSPFTEQEREQLPAFVGRAADALAYLLDNGLERTMTEFNRR
jgi:PTH1 family peptidyl-tRNA hydrolase